MLTIDRATYDAIVAHASGTTPTRRAASSPGPAGSDRPERFVEMVNAAGSPTFYEFDSTDLLHLYKEMDERDEEPVVIYHSHTATEAYPSRTDIGLAMEPNAHYVLVSTREHGNNEGPVEFRSYRIVDGEVTEEEVTVVGPPAQSPTRTRSTPDGHRGPDPDHPAHLHRRREGRDRRRRQPGRADRRPRDQPPRAQGAAARAQGRGRDLRRFVNVYVNDEDVRFLGGLEAEVSDGDQVVVLPAVAGG